MILKRSGEIDRSSKGKITTIIGAMFAGKTTELLRLVSRYSRVNMKCIIIKHKKDDRFSKDEVVSHDQIKQKSLSFSTLVEAEEMIESYDVIAIDEGQLFPDLVEKSDQWANKGKKVIVAMLNGTFRKTPFEGTHGMISISEELISLNAICPVCHEMASFTKRLNDSTAEIEIGGEDMYAPACRTHFNMEISEFKQYLKTPLNKSN